MHIPPVLAQLGPDDALLDRLALASAEFARRLRAVRPEQWHLSTPCAEWDTRQLVNHVVVGDLCYVRLLSGGTAADFERLRHVDALGPDPVDAYTRSAQQCRDAFARPGALRQQLDYPLGPVTARQALAVRTADIAVHTWDLAQTLGADDRLDSELAAWLDTHLDTIYSGLPETPAAPQDETTHRFFAAPPQPAPGRETTPQDRLLHRTGRTPAPAAPRIT